ncbi:MAG: ABC transporter ATP-binding protein [Geothrix sp.]|uniref:ABC transporter ATP-binding protein n=1 Tax=Geothrix sp. TaxID=1962974 RepID=UPI0017EDE53F|nr:ABC transporter ATP-binding protein [Geothrix sp.]NWJ42494.1 ABC transporter ATP-binding protein [Geothrix sp.]WIL19544.1 MAG: ABC transporter ATP-binding protein [Geothrix sp.]
MISHALPSPPSLVVAEGLTKRFGETTALDKVSFAISPGEIIGYVGPNGAGKTTTMRILTGMETAFGGDVRISGMRQPLDRKSILGQISYLPQDVAFAPWRTAWETLWLFGRLSGISEAPLRQRIREVLQQVGLSPKAETRVGTFSRGMKQRLGLAQAMLNEPKLMILDEPFNHLDPGGRQHVKGVLAELNRKGVAIIFSSHILADVEELMQRLLVIRNGRLIFDGTVDALKAEHRDAEAVEIGFTGILPHARLSALPGVARLELMAPNVMRLHPVAGADLLAVATGLLGQVIASGHGIRFVKPLVPSLEAIVGQMTGSPTEGAREQEEEGMAC